MSIIGQRRLQRDNWNLMEKDYILRCLIALFLILISQNFPLHCFLSWPCLQFDSVFQTLKFFTNNKNFSIHSNYKN